MNNIKPSELADALSGATGVKYTAFNTAVRGRTITPSERPWVLAFVEPSTLTDWWWVSILKHGGAIVSHTIPTPTPSIPSVLAQMGVTPDAAFAAESAVPSSHNRWLVKPTKDDRDTRPVYFIQAANGLVKIGVAANPDDRLRALRTMSPISLRLLLTIPGVGAAGEAELHRRFADHRSHGEWFRPAAELTAFIQEHK
jgi:hypothetical protein